MFKRFLSFLKKRDRFSKMDFISLIISKKKSITKIKSMIINESLRNGNHWFLKFKNPTFKQKMTHIRFTQGYGILDISSPSIEMWILALEVEARALGKNTGPFWLDDGIDMYFPKLFKEVSLVGNSSHEETLKNLYIKKNIMNKMNFAFKKNER
jgi:hypothetical protein